MKFRFGSAIVAVLAVMCFGTSRPLAQDHAHGALKSDRWGDHNALVQAIREVTAQFKDVRAAEAAGYELMFGCVSGPDDGAMGLHYVNLPLVLDGVLDPSKPEIIIYEPLPNGRLKMTGADFLVFAADWHASNAATPELQGQLLHLFESPNRFGLPNFYTLHVWAWKENPTGTFSNWHSNVSCDAFVPARTKKCWP